MLISVTPFGNLMSVSSFMDSSASGVKAHEVSRAGCRDTPHRCGILHGLVVRFERHATGQATIFVRHLLIVHV